MHRIVICYYRKCPSRYYYIYMLIMLIVNNDMQIQANIYQKSMWSLKYSASMAHILMVSSPGQGHVNPLLRLAKLLASKGIFVTFTTDDCTGTDMIKACNITPHHPIPVGDGFISFEFFPLGWPANDPRRADLDQFTGRFETVGKDAVAEIINRNADQKRPVSCLIHTPFIPWVSDVVAEEFGLPSAMLWIQSCACFAAYYCYYHGLARFPTESDPKTEVNIPCMPLLKYDEIPSFLHPWTQYPFLARAILRQFETLHKVSYIMIETFNDLESEIVDYMSILCPNVKTVGPLFKYPLVQSADAVRGDFIKASDGCIEWLDTRPESSVVYVSFGSFVELKQEQVDEIAYGLLNAGVSFLWALKQPNKLPRGFLERVGERGKVVRWSPQEKVLAHSSVACFLTHCGWNSTMEAVTSGTPVVAFPNFGDQVTDAVYLVDVWKVGVRMSRGDDLESRFVPREEVQKCLRQAVVGPKAEEMKRNMLKLKEAAAAAVEAGGSSWENVQSFVDEMKAMETKVLYVEVQVMKKADEPMKAEVGNDQKEAVEAAVAAMVGTNEYLSQNLQLFVDEVRALGAKNGLDVQVKVQLQTYPPSEI